MRWVTIIFGVERGGGSKGGAGVPAEGGSASQDSDHLLAKRA